MRTIKAVITIIILTIISAYIFKHSEYGLACGIFAWVGKDVKYFRRDLFNILGMYNDSRGGDSTGIFYDGISIKGIGTTAKYENLIPKYDLHNALKLKKYPVIIGHDRKNSVGGITMANAQPVLLEREEDDIVYVQAHNGTITNYRALATKYDVDILTGESDSIVMAKLIEKVGFKVLSEYEGSGAFVMYFKDEPNALYAFHGKSKSSEYSVVLSEERPLAYLNIPGRGTFIASDSDHLANLANLKKNEKAIEFEHNVLYKLERDTITKVGVYDRSKVTTKNIIISYSSNMNSVKKSLQSYEGNLTDNCIRFHRGFYVSEVHGDILHGIYYVDNWGFIIKNPKAASPKYELCFIHGILMKNRDSYEKASAFVKLNKLEEFEDFYDRTNFTTLRINDFLKEHSRYPFIRHTTSEFSMSALRPKCMPDPKYANAGSYYYDGDYRPLFSRYLFRMWNGDVTYVKSDLTMYTMKDYFDDNTDFIFSVSPDLEEQVTKTEKVEKTGTKKNDDKDDDNDCVKCGIYATNPEHCREYCYTLPIEKTKKDADVQYEKAYKAYEDGNENSTMAINVIEEEFKDLYKAIENCIDVYDSVSADITDEDIIDVINDIKNISIKINK